MSERTMGILNTNVQKRRDLGLFEIHSSSVVWCLSRAYYEIMRNDGKPPNAKMWTGKVVHAEISTWFEGMKEYITEQPMELPIRFSEYTLNGTPDLIEFIDDQIIFYDWKTKDKDVEFKVTDTLQRYGMQIASYAYMHNILNHTGNVEYGGILVDVILDKNNDGPVLFKPVLVLNHEEIQKKVDAFLTRLDYLISCLNRNTVPQDTIPDYLCKYCNEANCPYRKKEYEAVKPKKTSKKKVVEEVEEK